MAIPNATFLNDVGIAKDGKTLYVTDSAIGPTSSPRARAHWGARGRRGPKALEIPTSACEWCYRRDCAKATPSTSSTSARARRSWRHQDQGRDDDCGAAGMLDGIELVKDGEIWLAVLSAGRLGSVYNIDKDGKATVLAAA